MSIQKYWAGNIYGTNIGEFFLEFDNPDSSVGLTGVLRIMDRQFGLAVYRVSGKFENTLELAGNPVTAPDGIAIGEISISGRLTDEGTLKGTWKSAIETAGTFIAYPHGQEKQKTLPDESKGPEQIFTNRIELGALRLYSDAIADLARIVKRDFTSGKAIVTYTHRGNEVTKYLSDFEGEATSIGQLQRFKLHIQEPEGNGINKVTTVDLNVFGRNEVLVQGVNESWVTGQAESVARSLREHESPVVTTYKKFGLTLNQVIFMVLLVLTPAIDTLWQRALFVVSLLVLLQALVWMHSQFVPILVIYPKGQKASFIAKLAPSAISWIGTVLSGLLATYLFYLMTTP